MSVERKSRSEWISAALSALAEGGVDAVRVERLARSLGVTKGSFYWHFRDRGDLLEATVDAWEEGGTEQIIQQAEAAGGDGATRILRLWESTGRDSRLASELAIRDWARRDQDIAARVQAVDDRRMQYLRELLGELGVPSAEIEARAMMLASLLIGNYFIRARHGRRSRRTVIADAVAFLIRVDG